VLAIDPEHSVSGVCGFVRSMSAKTYDLNENYELFPTNYKELCQMNMDMRSQMSGTCVPFYWPYSPGNDQPPPPLVPHLF